MFINEFFQDDLENDDNYSVDKQKIALFVLNDIYLNSSSGKRIYSFNHNPFSSDQEELHLVKISYSYTYSGSKSTFIDIKILFDSEKAAIEYMDRYYDYDRYVDVCSVN